MQIFPKAKLLLGLFFTRLFVESSVLKLFPTENVKNRSGILPLNNSVVFTVTL